MSKDFYPDLKLLQDNLFVPEKVSEFIAVLVYMIQNYGLHAIIENATSATNEKSKNRLRDLFKRISTTQYFGNIILMFDSNNQNQAKLINKFMKSQNSDMIFQYFENYSQRLVTLISKQPKYVSILLRLIEHSSGLKVLKTFQKIYKNNQNLETIYSEEAKQQLIKGIQNQDSTISMRYIQLAVNIATFSQKGFHFISNGKMLQQALNHYDTKDTLLKLNVVQIIETFGNSLLTAQFLKKSTIWQKIVAQAFNVDEQFYIRKSLIVLIAKMSSQNCYEITPLAAKNFTVFLKEMLTSKLIDEIDAGLDVICYLGKTVAGLQVIVNSQQITQHYVAISRAAGDNTKLKYINSLDSIVDRKSQNKSHATIVTLLSCIGDVTLAKSYNLKGSHPVLSGLPKFAQWFYSVLNLPFEQLKLATIELYRQLLQYKQVCVELFGVNQAMQFFKRKLHRYDLIGAKKILIEQILKHGETNWKGHQLQVFVNLLRTQMIQGQSNEVQYAVQSK